MPSPVPVFLGLFISVCDVMSPVHFGQHRNVGVPLILDPHCTPIGAAYGPLLPPHNASLGTCVCDMPCRVIQWNIAVLYMIHICFRWRLMIQTLVLLVRCAIELSPTLTRLAPLLLTQRQERLMSHLGWTLTLGEPLQCTYE